MTILLRKSWSAEPEIKAGENESPIMALKRYCL